MACLQQRGEQNANPIHEVVQLIQTTDQLTHYIIGNIKAKTPFAIYF